MFRSCLKYKFFKNKLGRCASQSFNHLTNGKYDTKYNFPISLNYGQYHINRCLTSLIEPDVLKRKRKSGNYVKEKMLTVFQDIIEDLKKSENDEQLLEPLEKFAIAFKYTVTMGKLNRGYSLVEAYKGIESPHNLNLENVHLAYVLGCCVEMMQASILIIDDIVDASEIRRGIPCWYKVEGVGINAIRDAHVVANSVFYVLKKYFDQKECYMPIIELMHEAFFKTLQGQILDGLCLENGNSQLNLFTMDRYNAIVKYKTSFYSFQLPAGLALYLAKVYDPNIHKKIENLALKTGQHFQVRDDFMDCFGDSNITGKNGTDIRNGKCTWLIVEALQMATPQEKIMLKEHYGKPNSESEAIVYKLYQKLDLENIYYSFNVKSLNDIYELMDQLSSVLSPEFFLKFVHKQE